MMNTNLADVMIHIDETLDHTALETIRDVVIAQDGVGSASFHDDKPHSMIIMYDPRRINSHSLLETVQGKGVHAELIGL